jgi:valyl-tRNA synthetase
MEQWFVRVKPLAERAITAIKTGNVTFTPASRGDVLIKYFKNLHDWNISRQIVWGIPIPAFQNVADSNDWIFDTRVEQPTIEINGKTYKREEDTFDTWFSSGQWPFITTDYLEKGELSRFYPLSVMETAGEILFAWVARMLMLGLYVTDQVPFKHVYLHGLVLDSHGKKMSKSRGNVINPMDMIDTYGSDALRMGVVAARSANQHQAFSPDKVMAARNFANKLWNIGRYIEGKVGQGVVTPALKTTSLADHWIAGELEQARAAVENNMQNYRFAEAADTIYHVIWNSVADWYLEANKVEENLTMLMWVLQTCLKLAHPFAPFVSETIWQTLKWDTGNLISAPWPEAIKAYDDIAAQEFEQLKALVSEARYVALELGGKKQTLVYGSDSLIDDNHALITRLAGLKEVKKIDNPKGLRLAVPGREAWLAIDEKTLKKHRKNLEERLEKVSGIIKNLETRLASDSYVANAPLDVVEETRQQLKQQTDLSTRLHAELELV